ncbi:SPOR domain-containing protein [Microbulbifer sp. OS29]|uniref:SPOR domain-containing protein n=1 Tax=Microbulbifer okhotskensis TaxID=2926617 RepID=A0A9X2EJM1_9GAMM|nr:SPOR domain-containing protein [Microbulbifer okhotskensis]MCO1332889.1 SPOR domain-containing protein [Microbulbifer okhotskensis]
MSRRNNSRRSKNSAGKPAWVWFVLGNFVGGFAVTLLFLYDMNGDGRGISGTKPQTLKQQKEASPQPRFDFYTKLKENEVTVPPPKVAQPERRSHTDNASQSSNSQDSGRSSAPPQVYILQAASFRDATEAERLRVELTLANLDVKVESATDNRGTWHRVLVGPYNNRSRMAKARQVLAEHRLMPLVLKRPAAQ